MKRDELRPIERLARGTGVAARPTALSRDHRAALTRLALLAISFLFALSLLAALSSAVKAAPLEAAAITAPSITAASVTGAGAPPAPEVAEGRPLLIDGERLDFDVSYGVIPAGHAWLEVKSDTTPEGNIYRITSRARSNGLVSMFFVIDDSAVTELDAATYKPKHFEKQIREGSLRKHVAVSYAADGSISAGDETFRVAPGTRDVLSALYYIRGQDLRVGEDVIVRTFENGKSCQARVKVTGREKVSTRRGVYECLVVEPDVQEGLFAKSGRIVIYLTDDALKLPVLIKSKVKIGSFAAELVDSSHLGGQI